MPPGTRRNVVFPTPVLPMILIRSPWAIENECDRRQRCLMSSHSPWGRRERLSRGRAAAFAFARRGRTAGCCVGKATSPPSASAAAPVSTDFFNDGLGVPATELLGHDRNSGRASVVLLTLGWPFDGGRPAMESGPAPLTPALPPASPRGTAGAPPPTPEAPPRIAPAAARRQAANSSAAPPGAGSPRS